TVSPDILISTVNNIGVAAAITTDEEGNLYVADSNDWKIKKTDVATREQTIVADFAGLSVYDMEIAPSGDIYIAGYNGVVKINAIGGARTVITNTGAIYIGLGIDKTRGWLYIARDGNTKLQKVSIADNSITDMDGVWDRPTDVAVDKDGNLYVTQFGQTDDNSLKKVNLATDNSTVTIASRFINAPLKLVVDQDGVAYVAGATSGVVKVLADGSTVDVPTDMPQVATVALDKVTGIVYAANDNSFAGTVVMKKIAKVGYYTISPALPAGLTINENTGVIGGTPTTSTPATDYKVTTLNTFGSASGIINITTLSGNADLASLTSIPALSPAFDSGTISYSA
ncbi:MAG: hypothetical protein EOP54_32440, partial [Sphingobacteriales bacterium]